jgi:histidine triad (HIT) family protein
VHSHQPADYQCRFCRRAAELNNGGDWSKLTDTVWHDSVVTAFMNRAFWPANPGPVLVIPNEQYENVYVVPDEVLAAVQVVGKRIALAMKAAYGCDGTSFRQHNEPAGSQTVWHYHLHVFPRYHGDDLYLRSREARVVMPAERAPFAEKLRSALKG